MKKKFVVFDFDGVVADSFKAAFEVNKMIFPSITEELFKKRFEGNFYDWEKSVNLRVDEVRNEVDFFGEYTVKLKNEVKIFSGIKEAIADLAGKFELIIISSTISAPIVELLAKNGLDGYFLQVMGSDVHKSKVEKFKMIFKEYGIGFDDCVMITDTLGDMREAREVGVSSIAVTWGFHSLEVIRRGRPVSVVEKPSDLLGIINKYFEGEYELRV